MILDLVPHRGYYMIRKLKIILFYNLLMIYMSIDCCHRIKSYRIISGYVYTHFTICTIKYTYNNFELKYIYL